MAYAAWLCDEAPTEQPYGLPEPLALVTFHRAPISAVAATLASAAIFLALDADAFSVLAFNAGILLWTGV